MRARAQGAKGGLHYHARALQVQAVKAQAGRTQKGSKTRPHAALQVSWGPGVQSARHVAPTAELQPLWQSGSDLMSDNPAKTVWIEHLLLDGGGGGGCCAAAGGGAISRRMSAVASRCIVVELVSAWRELVQAVGEQVRLGACTVGRVLICCAYGGARANFRRPRPRERIRKPARAPAAPQPSSY